VGRCPPGAASTKSSTTCQRYRGVVVIDAAPGRHPPISLPPSLPLSLPSRLGQKRRGQAVSDAPGRGRHRRGRVRTPELRERHEMLPPTRQDLWRRHRGGGWEYQQVRPPSLPLSLRHASKVALSSPLPRSGNGRRDHVRSTHPPSFPPSPFSSHRRALGSIVFSSPTERKRLEGIVWPEIRRLMEQDIQALGEVPREGGREGGRTVRSTA